jgi:hypothetical protein
VVAPGRKGEEGEEGFEEAEGRHGGYRSEWWRH